VKYGLIRRRLKRGADVEIGRIKNSTRDRYHALSISPIWNLDLVRKASALVIGAGALGNEVAKNLAMMGVQFIAVVDRDTVEVANLTRSVFFREDDHGRLKAQVLAERIQELNPGVSVLPLSDDLERVIGLGLVRRMDMIFSCLDNRLARRTVNRMCQKIGKPWVDGSMENLLGDVTVYFPDDGPCYECTLTRNDKEIIAQAMSCRGIALQDLALGKVPTTSTMGSIISAIQVQEALKVLHNNSPNSSEGYKLVINCGTNDFYTVRGERKEECEGHFRFGEISEVREWTRDSVSPSEILSRFEAETGRKGHLRLGRDVVIGLRCTGCGTEEELSEPLHLLRVDKARCPVCGEIRDTKTTNSIQGTEHYASWPLARLGVPPGEVLEVRSRGGSAWYEIGGDLDALFGSIGTDKKAADGLRS
jgi:molybdopterin/thiamine biosynthesis adenylyltransferase